MLATKKRLLLASVGIVLALLWLGLSRRNSVEGDHVGASVRVEVESGSALINDRQAPSPSFKHASAVSDARWEAFISDNLQNPEMLVAAVYLRTDRPEYLRLLEKFADNPRACAALAHLSSSAEDQKSWAMKLKLLKPDDGHGDLLCARAQLKLGQTAEAIDSFRRGLELGKLTVSAKEIELNVRDALRQFGATSGQSATQAQFNTWWDVGFIHAMAKVSNQVYEATIDSGDDRFDAVEEQVQFARMLGDLDSNNWGEINLHSTSMERKALNRLDPETPYGDNGLTVKDRMGELVADMMATNTQSDENALMLAQVGPELRAKYYERYDSFGGKEAYLWLRKQPQAEEWLKADPADFSS